MGQARQRGSYEERVVDALLKPDPVWRVDGTPNSDLENLQLAVRIFRESIPIGSWLERRKVIENYLSSSAQHNTLLSAPPLRFSDDEMGWYIYLAETTVSNTFAVDTSQAARALPFLVGIASRWHYRNQVDGITKKINEAMTRYRKAPDGILFELLVALSYAESGWHVTFIPEGSSKQPDFKAEREGYTIFVECKRQSRRSQYSDEEHSAWLRIWERTKPYLMEFKQWLWFDIVFHKELKTLPGDYLLGIFQASLPYRGLNVATLASDETSTVRVRPANREALEKDLSWSFVKISGSKLPFLLGGDWANPSTQSTFVCEARSVYKRTKDGKILPTGRYIEAVKWATGASYRVDAPEAIAKKARHFKNLLVDAAEQLPNNAPAIVHVAVETMEGREVDPVRKKVIEDMVTNFAVENPDFAVILHYLQANCPTDKIWEIDETVSDFWSRPFARKMIPHCVVVPYSPDWKAGSHWELYP